MSAVVGRLMSLSIARKSITPGQSMAFYSDDVVLAGGKIV
jgi:tRNA U34 2-thiouridine synthase MnmA/TrmU